MQDTSRTGAIKSKPVPFEVIRRGRPDFIGLRPYLFRSLFGAAFVDMLFAVDHRLGDSRKLARGVRAPRLFCFNAGFLGSPNGGLIQTG